MRMTFAWLCRLGLAALLGLGVAQAAPVQDWPAPGKPVMLVVGNAAGGGTDVIARVLAERLQGVLQRPVVVENKPGASGMLAAALTARSPADGQTLLVTPITLVTTPHVLPKAAGGAVDVMTDLAPVVQLSRGALLLVTRPAQGLRDARALAARAKEQPVSYGTPGAGSPMHIAGELFRQAADVPLTHVPYKGVAPALSDLLGDHVTVVFSDLASASSYLQSGQLVAIGVTQAQRSPLLPEVPTLAEQGFRDVAFETWFGVFAPAGTPAATVAKVGQAINQVLAQPETRRRFAALGEVVVGGSPQDFATRVRADFDQFGRIVRAFGISVD